MLLRFRKDKGNSALQNMVIQLRKICQHPFVFRSTELDIDPGSADGGATDKVWRSSGKFELLDRILPKLFRTNHKVGLAYEGCLPAIAKRDTPSRS